jgi:hypothetical protein
MLVADEAVAEAIAGEVRKHGMRADMVEVDGASLASLQRSGR